MGFNRSRPLIAQLSEDKLVVVGGSSGKRDDLILTEIIIDEDADKKRQK